VMRYLTGGRPTPREELRDEVIPFHLAVYERLDRLGTDLEHRPSAGQAMDVVDNLLNPADLKV
jgi:hypothetical protein